MESAIKKAIEGGFQPRAEVEMGFTGSIAEQCLLNPLLWQALGKAEGWKQPVIVNGEEKRAGSGWWCKWHDFIDHLAEGKDVNSFFEELLK